MSTARLKGCVITNDVKDDLEDLNNLLGSAAIIVGRLRDEGLSVVMTLRHDIRPDLTVRGELHEEHCRAVLIPTR